MYKSLQEGLAVDWSNKNRVTYEYNLLKTKEDETTTYSRTATRWENAAITENNFISTPESKLQSHSSRTWISRENIIRKQFGIVFVTLFSWNHDLFWFVILLPVETDRGKWQ